MKATVESIAFGGKGVVRSENKVYFIPFTIPGEDITFDATKEKKSYGEGAVRTIITPSPHRVLPRCKHYTHCGGCTLQHMDYETQCHVKKQMVLDALTRIGKFPKQEVTFHPSPKPWGYRKHVRLNLRTKGKGYIAGYIGFNANQFIPIEECHLTSMDIPSLQQRLASLDHSGIENISLRVFTTETTPVLAFSSSPTIPKNGKEWAAEWGIPILFKSPKKMTTHGTIPKGLNPYGFTQCNQEVADSLYSHITSLLQGTTTLLDLYGGSGLLALSLASMGKRITLVEANKTSCKEAEANARQKGVPLTVVPTAVEEFPFRESYDAVLINPPREGLSKQALQNLLSAKIPSLIYTSCMPATLARDLRIAHEHGYTLSQIDTFDMFPQTTHVETVCALQFHYPA